MHGGPFANIAHGCNSILATRMEALATADYAVTEAGFAFDLGGEEGSSDLRSVVPAASIPRRSCWWPRFGHSRCMVASSLVP